MFTSKPTVPPKELHFSEKKPKKIETHTTTNVPQNQCLRSLLLLPLVSMKIPESKIRPAKIKEAIPKPRCIKNSLTQAPVLLSQFCDSKALFPNSESVL